MSVPIFEPSNRYKPFGLYLFCSETGVSCFSEPEFVLELLGAFCSKSMQLTDYGLVLEDLKDKAIVKERHLGGLNNNPLCTGIILKLQAIGMHEMQVLFLFISDKFYKIIIFSLKNKYLC